MNSPMESAYSIKLPAFEGPMDLLLHLIKEQKIDIYDIPIALITRQYLEYLEMMKDLNLEVAGEFLLMAATLIHIKSRMLLPVEDTAETEELEDPRLELVMRLLEYKAFKDAALGFKEREEQWADVQYREPRKDDAEEAQEEPMLFDMSLFDLMEAFKRILENAPPEVRTITREALTIKDRMNVIIDALQARDAVRFEDLFRKALTRTHFIVTFVALLELVRLGLARAYQEHSFGAIWIINPESGHKFLPGLIRQREAASSSGQAKTDDRKSRRGSHDRLPGSGGLPRDIHKSARTGLPARGMGRVPALNPRKIK